MQLSGVSLNIISLGGLALGVGMLVDNSIVVLESIFRCREEGDDFVKSTIRGVSEVGGAVVASTLTTISVFFSHRFCGRRSGWPDFWRYGPNCRIFFNGIASRRPILYTHVSVSKNW